MIAPPARGLGQCLERHPHPLGEVGPLPIHQPLELGRGPEMEPVEQRAAVRRDRPLEFVPRERRLEVIEIDGDDAAIEPQLGGTGCDVRLADIASQGVQQLREGVVGALRITLGPEVGHELVAAHTLVPPQCQERQQRQGSSWRGRTREGPLVAREGERTERRQPERRPAPDAHLTAL